MNEYERIALETRKKVSKLTLEQQRQILKTYEKSISKLAKKATSARDESLSKRWLLDYTKELKQAKKELAKEIKDSLENSISKAAAIGTEGEQLIFTEIFKMVDIDTGEHFTTMFSQVQKGVIEDIISGNLYRDKKTLSQRIWSHSDKFEKDIQYIINRGILEKKSALELARDLEKFVKEPAKREWEWSKVYPNLTKTKIDYNAQRLARTAINHAYQTASIKSSNMNPFVEGIEWRSAQIHDRTCDLCFERHGKVFPKDDVPLDHPSGLCTMLSYISKSLDEVADELHDWLYDGNNPILDDWYKDYGDYFAFKKLGDSYNKGFKDIMTGRTAGQNTRESPINDKDVYSINKYISSESYRINEGLRNRTGLTKEQMDLANGLDTALSKVPNYEGDLSRSLFFFSEEDVEKFIKGYEIGSMKTFNEYLSTTKGETYNPYGQVEISIINSMKGKDISEYNPGEQEILYPRGSKFKILDIRKNNDKYNITMEEDDDDD